MVDIDNDPEFRITARNWYDDDGVHPVGGVTYGHGFCIAWQDGPKGPHSDPNGAYVEAIIKAVIQRLEFFQDSKLACDENSRALLHLDHALDWLTKRLKDREERGVRGTHQP